MIPRRHFLRTIPSVAAALFTAAMLGASASRAADLSQAETAELLARLQAHRQRHPSLTADFTEQKTSRLLQKPLTSQGTLTFKAPNKFRRELRGNNPSITVSNGQKLWIYYPNFKEAELYALGQRPFFDDAIAALTAGFNFQDVSSFYRYSAASTPDGYRLVLTPKGGGLKRVLRELTIWLDKEHRIEKTVAVLPQGDQVATDYRNQKPASVADSIFEFSPPSDARVSQPLGK